MGKSVNFKLTVIGRLATVDCPNLDDVRIIIKSVLAIPDLMPQSYEDYQTDMRDLAVQYGVQTKDLLDLIPEIAPTLTVIHGESVEEETPEDKG